MTDTSEIKALLFDVFGTVVDWRSGVAHDVDSFLARHASSVDAFELANAWRRQYSPAMEEIRSGRRAFVRLDLLHMENLTKVLTDFGIKVGSIPAEELAELKLGCIDSVRGLILSRGCCG
ncbi:FMN phosphatase YigB (HAD superfamily) [Paraburkholderia sp. GAS333]